MSLNLAFQVKKLKFRAVTSTVNHQRNHNLNTGVSDRKPAQDWWGMRWGKMWGLLYIIMTGGGQAWQWLLDISLQQYSYRKNHFTLPFFKPLLTSEIRIVPSFWSLSMLLQQWESPGILFSLRILPESHVLRYKAVQREQDLLRRYCC